MPWLRMRRSRSPLLGRAIRTIRRSRWMEKELLARLRATEKAKSNRWRPYPRLHYTGLRLGPRMRPRKGLARRLGRRPGKDMGLRPRQGRKGIVAERAPAGGIIEPRTPERAEAVSGGILQLPFRHTARVRELFKRLGLRDDMLVLDKLSAPRKPSFYGVPALGGTRHTHAAIKYQDKRRPRPARQGSARPQRRVRGRRSIVGRVEIST